MAEHADLGKRGRLWIGAGLLALFGTRLQAASGAAIAPIEQPAQAGDRAFIERAFAMRQLALDSGDQGYGAVVVCGGRIIAQAPSRVVTRGDPTAHAEMEAIRQAAERLGSRDLSACTLYSSTSACPMCEAAAYWAGIARQVSGRAIADGGRPQLCG